MVTDAYASASSAGRKAFSSTGCCSVMVVSGGSPVQFRTGESFPFFLYCRKNKCRTWKLNSDRFTDQMPKFAEVYKFALVGTES